jgi:hypothetical protein
MAQLLIRQKVKDHLKFKFMFDEPAAKPKAAGCKGGDFFAEKKIQTKG